MRAIDKTGQRFGRLTVLGLNHTATSNAGKERRHWLCRCDCGGEIVVAGGSLTAKTNTRSCGCLRRETSRARMRTHGASNGRTYKTWLAMRDRCGNVSSRSYPLYGAKGIRVCERWGSSFEAFLSDMGERPAGKSLDRIDPTGNYEPENCRWASPVEQATNRGPVHQIEYGGQVYSAARFAKMMGVGASYLCRRLARGEDPLAAVSAIRSRQAR